MKCVLTELIFGLLRRWVSGPLIICGDGFSFKEAEMAQPLRLVCKK
jgi:hypothetical protein